MRARAAVTLINYGGKPRVCVRIRGRVRTRQRGDILDIFGGEEERRISATKDWPRGCARIPSS